MGNGIFVRNARKQSILLVACIGIVTAPISVAHAQSDEAVGGGIGGLLGGVAGQLLGKKGDKTVTTLIGAGLGALIGSQIAKGLSKRDNEKVATSTRDTIHTGETRTWTGDKGSSGSTRLTATDRREGQVNVPVIKERITQLPPLDFINASYAATKKENVRGGPGSDYKIVAEVKKNEVVTVTGKVQDMPWYLISQNGVGTGFVHEKSLKATTAAPVQTAQVAGTVEAKATQMKRTCRTVTQTVVQGGKEKSENVTACQTADGWEVV